VFLTKTAKSQFVSKNNDTQASFADAVNVAGFFLTNSCTLSGRSQSRFIEEQRGRDEAAIGERCRDGG
jgi:hypothetical protein